jgi:uncharacterized membrane protein YcaP (DUF421 family)
MSTIIHAVIGYFWLLFTVRFLSRRPGAQLTPFEFVFIFLIGGVIILSTVGSDRSETNSVIAVMTIALLHRLVSTLATRHRVFGAILEGIPLILMEKGQWRTDIKHNMKIQDMDVMAAARVKGVKSFDQIRYAILERLGSISIVKEEKKEDK